MGGGGGGKGGGEDRLSPSVLRPMRLSFDLASPLSTWALPQKGRSPVLDLQLFERGEEERSFQSANPRTFLFSGAISFTSNLVRPMGRLQEGT